MAALEIPNEAPPSKEHLEAVREGFRLGRFLFSHSTAGFKWCSRSAFVDALVEGDEEAVAFYQEWLEEGQLTW